MTVEQIIEAVRFCYDEEKMDGAAFNNASANDNTYMDHIIKSKIGDAVRWICLYAPADLLGGSDEEDGSHNPVDTGILVDKDNVTVQTAVSSPFGEITLEADFIKLARVKISGWKMAVTKTIDEGTEEYMQLIDENGATATVERPRAVIINRSTKILQVWPTGTTGTYTYVASVGDNSYLEDPTDPTSTLHYPLPPKAKTAFIYYLAFLVLSAYEDSRAQRMLEIAKMNIGKNS